MGQSQQTDPPRHLFSVPQAEKPAIIVQAVTDIFTTLFPNRIRAIYLIGSHIDQSAASMSDIDGGIIFKDCFVDEAEQSLAETDASGLWPDPIVTEITAVSTFYEAEDYHQNYYKTNRNQPYCRIVIDPKIRKLRKSFANRLQPA